MTCVIHTWEDHVLGIFVFVFCTNYKVGILFVGRGFLLALVDRFAFCHHRAAILSVAFERYL